MKKQILLLASLALFAWVHPAVAAPTNSAGSTEDADRKFLENLEKADAAHNTKAAPAPATAKPAPIAKVQHSRELPKSTESKVIVRKSPTLAFGGSAELAAPSEEAAEVDPLQDSPTRTTTVVVVRPLNQDRADRHHHEHHGFFHRLFGKLLSDQHPEDW